MQNTYSRQAFTAPEKELKELFIIGPGCTKAYSEIIDIISSSTNRNKCLIIGDGEREIDTNYIKNELKSKGLKIGKNTWVDILSHGNRDSEGNHVTAIIAQNDTQHTHYLLQDIAEMSAPHSPYIHLWACFGSSANKAAYYLPKDSILVTHIEAKQSASIPLTNYTINASLKRYLDPENDNLTPEQQFIGDLLENYEAATFNKRKETDLTKFKFRLYDKDIKHQDNLGQKDIITSLRVPQNGMMNQIFEGIKREDNLRGYLSSFFHYAGLRFKNVFPEASINEQLKTIIKITDQQAKDFLGAMLIHTSRLQDKQADKTFEKILNLSVEQGIDINNPISTLNAPPLTLVSIAGSNHKVKLLLEAGASTETLDSFGLNALAWSCHRGSIEVADMLLKGGANPKARLKGDDSPLKIAQDFHPEMLEMLNRYIDRIPPGQPHNFSPQKIRSASPEPKPVSSTQPPYTPSNNSPPLNAPPTPEPYPEPKPVSSTEAPYTPSNNSPPLNASPPPGPYPYIDPPDYSAKQEFIKTPASIKQSKISKNENVLNKKKDPAKRDITIDSSIINDKKSSSGLNQKLINESKEIGQNIKTSKKHVQVRTTSKTRKQEVPKSR